MVLKLVVARKKLDATMKVQTQIAGNTLMLITRLDALCVVILGLTKPGF